VPKSKRDLNRAITLRDDPGGKSRQKSSNVPENGSMGGACLGIRKKKPE